MEGVKSATASTYDLYGIEDEPLSTVGEYSVVLDLFEQAVCIIRTTRVYVASYADVTAAHTFLEGEGDRSLAYWRSVHAPFFTCELASVGLSFNMTRRVVCEEFELVWKDEQHAFLQATPPQS